MTTIKGILFDLDGTLIDSLPGLVATANLLRQEYGLPIADFPTVASWIGDGVKDFLTHALAKKHEEIHETDLAAFYRIYLKEPLLESQPFAGIEEMLNQLQPNYLLAIVTNKPRRSVEPLLEARNWNHYFTAVICPEDVGVRKPDRRIVDAALTKMNLTPQEALFVGDSPFDILAARNAAITCMVVDWGYSPANILTGLQPDAMIDSPKQLLQYVFGVSV